MIEFSELLNSTILWIQSQGDNDILIGIAGGTIVGGLFYSIRSLPGQIFGFINRTFQRLFVSRISIYSEDNSFDWISIWSAKQRFSKKSRKLQLLEQWDEAENTSNWHLTAAEGRHYFLYKWWPFVLQRTIDDTKGPGGGARRETYRFATLGFRPHRIKKLINEIKNLRYAEETESVTIKSYINDYWYEVTVKARRPIDSIFLEDDIKGDILDDLEDFKNSKEWYLTRGLPWRRGYMLAGAPGTGKSSLVFALASHTNRNIYTLNLATLRNDHDLTKAIATVDKNAFLLIEDVDAYTINKIRAEKGTEEKSQRSEDIEVTFGGGITLSGLLNALDGVVSKDGLIVFMTSNHPETIDSALLRPGRIDVYKTLRYMNNARVVEMWNYFYPEEEELGKKLKIKGLLSPAAIQVALLKGKDDPKRAFEAIKILDIDQKKALTIF